MATVVLGAQWGDEGKGKLTDILCSKASLCARAQGGNNAGHSTIVANGQTYDFHILPSGLVNPNCLNLVGSGCVVHIPSFFKELDNLHKKGLNTESRIFLSDRAHVVFDLHLLIDGLQEGELTEAAEAEQLNNGQVAVAKKSSGGAIGTTRKGIGPAYSAKHARSGVRMHQIFNKEEFDRRLKVLAKGAQRRYGELQGYDVEDEIAKFDTYREKLAPFVVDAVPLMDDAQKKGANILVEGANALMLDIDHGTYPFVTSSATGIGGVFTGLALSPFKIKEVIGVVKAYTTRVGGGPFPTEQLNEDGESLQRLGREYGVTTGRKRRCGWLDLVLLKYSCAVNHYTALNLTKLDILDSFPTIKVGTAYKDTLTGDLVDSFPADLDVLERCEVLYEELEGWGSSSVGKSRWEELPEGARGYVEFIEGRVGVRVKYIGTGVEREAMIVR
ncbi:MAG: hypothetical protein LQ343_003686 [Gyalolechia ehrenbergii]|nr:MAG: hypothetical protein LQ343_003686 [Gyalolechia ehrenbergii]